MNLKEAMQKARFVINQLNKAQSSFIKNSFDESVAYLFAISSEVMPYITYLKTSSNLEAQKLAEELQTLFTNSMDLVDNMRQTQAQPEGKNLKLMLIEQAKINDAKLLTTFLRKHDYGMIQIGGEDALSHALRYAATFGCYHNIPVLIKAGANSLRSGNTSGLALHCAIKKLEVKCVKLLLESLDTQGGYYCDIKQLLALNNNKDALGLLTETNMLSLSSDQKNKYIEILELIIKHLNQPDQSQISKTEDIKRQDVLLRAIKQLEAAKRHTESKEERPFRAFNNSSSSSSEILSELKKEETKNSFTAKSVSLENTSKATDSLVQPASARSLSSASLAEIKNKYTQEEMKEILTKLTALTHIKKWRIRNEPNQTFNITLGVTEEKQGLHWVSALSAVKVMNVAFIKHSDAELKKYSGLHKFTIKITNIDLPKLRELNSIEGFSDLNQQENIICPPGGARVYCS